MRTSTAKALRLLLAASVSLSALQGCAQMGMPGVAVDASDVCRAERQQMKDIETYFQQAIFVGAASGALLGGLGTALATGDAKQALIGAGVGAVVGGVGGYFVARQQAASGGGQLAEAIYGDLQNENAQIDRVTAAFRGLRDCRFRAANAIKADLAAGRVARAEAQNRLAGVQALFQQDLGYAESMGAKIGERGREFDHASTEIAKIDPAAEKAYQERAKKDEAARLKAEKAAKAKAKKEGKPAPVVTASAKAPPKDASGVVELTATNQLKRQALDSEIAQSKAVAQNAFSLDAPVTALDATRLG